MKHSPQKVHLVLGCGGARGMAHIGVIEALEANGYNIVEVVGCSMGAVVGGLYCAGYLNTYKKWLLSLTRSSVRGFFDFTLTGSGFVKGERIFEKIQELTGEQNIENFKKPFTAVATNMITMEEVHYKSGNLYKALRATVSMPGLFVPVLENTALLVDGGVLNPLPLNLIKKKRNHIVVAVNLNGRIASIPEPKDVKAPENIAPPNTGWSAWLDMFTSWYSSPAKPEVPDFSFLELLSLSYNHTLDRLTQLMVQLYQPDILIEIPRDACDTFEFYRAEEIITLGTIAFEQATKQHLMLEKN